MDIITQVLTWVRSAVAFFVNTLFADNWFFACIIGFPVLRYFFKKFTKSF